MRIVASSFIQRYSHHRRFSQVTAYSSFLFSRYISGTRPLLAVPLLSFRDTGRNSHRLADIVWFSFNTFLYKHFYKGFVLWVSGGGQS